MTSPVRRFLPLVALLLATVPLLNGCAGCSNGGDDDDDDANPPAIASVVPAQGKIGTAITVTGSNFGDTQGTSTVLLGTVSVTPSSWSDSSLVLSVPAQAFPGGAPIVVTVDGTASNEGGFTVVLPSAVYVHNDESPLTISAFALGSDGTLSELAGSPYLAGGDSASFGGDNSALALYAPMRLLVASIDTALAAFFIDGVTGELDPVPGSPFATGVSRSFGVVFAPGGGFVFAGGYQSNDVAVLAIASNGALSPVPGSPFAGRVNGSPDGILAHRDGGWLLVNQESPQGIDVWSVAANGTILLTSTNLHPVSAGSIYTLAMHPTRDHFYGGGDGDEVVGYDFDVTDGSLTPLPGSPYASAGTMSPAVSADGNRLYVGNRVAGVDGFSIAADGSLTPLPGSPFPVGTGTLSIGLTADGRFALAAGESDQTLYSLTIGSSGALTQADTAVLPAGGEPSRVLVTP